MQRNISKYTESIHDKKQLKKMGVKGTSLIKVKAIYHKFTASIILNEEKLKDFPPKIRHKTTLPILTTLIE